MNIPPQDYIVTIIIIGLTCLISIPAFGSPKLIDDLIFYPPAISKRNQFYRFVTCGFIHADVMHLAFNMFSFYTFGQMLEGRFTEIFGDKGTVLYVVLYVSALVVCLLPTYFKHKDDYGYRSLGASGAVSAMIFCFILLYPTAQLGLIIIPIPAPAFIFGGVYLIITALLDKRGGGGINHSAHLWGALYGIAFIIVACNFMSSETPVQNFIEQIKNWVASF